MSISRPFHLVCTLLVLTTLTGQSFAADPSDTKPEPATKPAMDVKKILGYLESEYKLKLVSPDWRVRALAVVSLARLPQQPVTDKLVQLMDQDHDDVVRLLAWQAILSRVGNLKPTEFSKWVNSTYTMAEKGLFRGSLRVALINVMATAPANPRSTKIFDKIFAETNSWMPNDIPVLDALGRCLGIWHSSEIAEHLIAAMSIEDNATRAEYILQQAGCPVKESKTRLPAAAFEPTNPARNHVSSKQMWKATQADYASWLNTEKKASWKEVTKITGETWRDLQPLYLEPPVPLEEASANEALWRADFELPKADIKSFEVCFAVDATGSMQEVLDWLARDVRTMATALSACSLEPRIGLTFYRDHDDDFVTKNLPLSGNLTDLVKALETIGADGGGDIPEAVLEGLQDAIGKHKWSARTGVEKIIILVGDAPPHQKDVEKCLALAEKAKKDGFKIYAIKVTTNYGKNDLEDFDQIAQAGGGPSIEISFVHPRANVFMDINGKEVPPQTTLRPETQTLVASAPPSGHPGEKVLSGILSDAIRPQYRDRLGPIVKTLLAYSEPPMQPEVRKGFPANTPPTKTGDLKPQGK